VHRSGGQVAGTERAVTDAGLAVARIDAPGTLDSGDVLQSFDGVRRDGGRTNAEGIRRCARIWPAGPHRGAGTARPSPAPEVRVTALPTGPLAERAGLVGLAAFRSVREVDEESGCHVALGVSGADRGLGTAHRCAARYLGLDRSWSISAVRARGCVTCLNVLLPDR
jgi:hypothetical protein